MYMGWKVGDEWNANAKEYIPQAIYLYFDKDSQPDHYIVREMLITVKGRS